MASERQVDCVTSSPGWPLVRIASGSIYHAYVRRVYIAEPVDLAAAAPVATLCATSKSERAERRTSRLSASRVHLAGWRPIEFYIHKRLDGLMWRKSLGGKLAPAWAGCVLLIGFGARMSPSQAHSQAGRIARRTTQWPASVRQMQIN